MNKEQLRELQLVELDILSDFDRYCRENDIKYSISSGTLLGAVRHGGFIPWDDDVDIAMTRDNFYKLMTVWDLNPIQGYYMENYYRDANCSICHTKIRKDGTILRMKGDETPGKHSGIWIDIFVRDKVKNSWWASNHVKIQCIKKVLATRGNETFAFDSGKNQFIKKLLKLIPNSIRRKIFIDAEKELQRYSRMKDNYYWVSTSTARSCNYHFPKESLEKYCEVSFEGKSFMAFDDIDTLLEIEYGDYMKLPPEEKRICTHNPTEIKLN